jgi:hypothetical protein
MFNPTSRFGLTTLAVAALVVATCQRTSVAQPLVTGNLTIYYDFDEIVNNQFLDESGNGFAGTINEDGPGTLTLETGNALRGAGAANLQQSANSSDPPVFVDVDGKNITDNFPDRLPTSGLNGENGFTVAAWVNVTANDSGDQSVFQGRTSDGGHGVPHFQLQGNGKLRTTFRNQTGGTVVNAPQVFTDGSETNTAAAYPANEWFHYAGTYDMDSNTWAMYYNGAQIATGTGTGEALGDWGGQPGDFFAAGIGTVYDSGGRRLDGLVDEFYVFNRALSVSEIGTLAVPEPTSLVLIPFGLCGLLAARRRLAG